MNILASQMQKETGSFLELKLSGSGKKEIRCQMKSLSLQWSSNFSNPHSIDIFTFKHTHGHITPLSALLCVR